MYVCVIMRMHNMAMCVVLCVFAGNGRSRKRYFLRDGEVITFFRPFPPIFRYTS